MPINIDRERIAIHNPHAHRLAHIVLNTRPIELKVYATDGNDTDTNDTLTVVSPDMALKVACAFTHTALLNDDTLASLEKVIVDRMPRPAYAHLTKVDLL